MARGASTSGAHSGSVGARASSPAAGNSAGGLRQRRTGGGGAASAGPRKATVSEAGMGVLTFFSEEGDGLKVGPNAVLVVTVIFILSVIALHIFGRIAS